MSEAQKQELIILRRYEADEEQAKGGVWKIAHADFMTAMMAFFLVMWLINVADEETKKSVANYFNPVKLVERSSERKGLLDPQGKSNVNLSPPPGEEIMPGTKTEASQTGGEDRTAAAPRQRFKEGLLFQDPYAVLAKLAAELDNVSPRDVVGIDGTPTETGKPGLNGGEAQRDPFDPLYWQVTPTLRPRTENPGPPETTSPVPREGSIDALAPKPTITAPTPDKNGSPNTTSEVAQNTLQAEVLAPERNETKQPDAQAAQLEAEITRAVRGSGGPVGNPRVDVRGTGEGVLISITDDLDFSMFAIGSAEPQPKVVRAMERIAKILNERQGHIIIRGHTDARPFRSDTYDNWRLSTARAHMASYMLIRGGFPDSRIERVEGHAERSLKNKTDPLAAENRRIEILVREKSP